MEKEYEKLQAITDKFLADFFKEATKIEKGNSTGITKSFNFNYTLPEMILNSSYVKKLTKDEFESPLIGMGFIDNLAKKFFNKAIQGVTKDVKFVLDNFDKQERYVDYRAKDLVVVEEKYIDPISTNPEYDWKRFNDVSYNVPMHISTEKIQIVSTFHIQNNKNSFEAIVKVIEQQNRHEKKYSIDSIEVMNPYNTQNFLRIRPRIDHDRKNKSKLTYKDEAEFTHYRHIADVNSFFYVLENIIYSIQHPED
jgi:hypothetical protein